MYMYYMLLTHSLYTDILHMFVYIFIFTCICIYTCIIGAKAIDLSRKAFVNMNYSLANSGPLVKVLIGI